MLINDFLTALKSDPSQTDFTDVIDLIDSHYEFSAAAFTNGDSVNEAGQNNGSCKILAFGQLHELSAEHTLHLFGDYYRKDVAEHPNGTDHSNIRNFMKFGWEGVTFSSPPLALKA